MIRRPYGQWIEGLYEHRGGPRLFARPTHKRHYSSLPTVCSEDALGIEAGRQLEELRDGPNRDESAQSWQEELPQKRAKERGRARREERSQARQEEHRRAQLA